MRKTIFSLLIGTTLAAEVLARAVHGEEAPNASSRASALVGSVHDAAGSPMPGVTISARATGSLVTTSVYADARGRYVFPALPAGNYQLWAQATGFAAGRAQAVVAGRPVASDFALTPLADPRPQLTGYEWFQSLPGKTTSDRRLTQILYVACTGCHSLDVALQNRFDESGWNAIMGAMENAFYNGYRPGDLSADQLRWEGQIIRHHHAELAHWLAQVRGPKTPATPPVILPRPSGDAARAVVTEYDLPVKEKDNEAAWYHGGNWELGPSTGMHGIVGIHDVVVDRLGKAWITQARTTFETNRSMIRLDPETGAMEAYRVTTPKGELMFFEQIATPDMRGMIWMHDGKYMVRLDPATQVFTSWLEPKVLNGMVNSTDTDSKGRAFANSSFGTVMFDPAEIGRTDVMYPGWHKFQQISPGDGVTYGITTDGRDNVWWSESYIDKVASRDMKTGKITEFDMHDDGYDNRRRLATSADLTFYASIGAGTWGTNSASPLPYMEMPRRLSADKHGTSVWVPMWAQSSLAEIDIRTHKVSYHRLPIQVHPYKTTVDAHHNVWTDTSLVDGAFRFAPSTKQWTLFRWPSHGCGSRHVSFDDLKNELWVPCDQSNKVIRVQFRSLAQLSAASAAEGLAQ